MTKREPKPRGPALGSGKSGGIEIGRLGGRPRHSIRCHLTTDDARTLRNLAEHAGVTSEALASGLLTAALAAEQNR